MQRECHEVFELDWDCLPAHLIFPWENLREHQMLMEHQRLMEHQMLMEHQRLMWPMWVELEESILQEVDILPSMDHDSVYIDHSLKQSHVAFCLSSMPILQTRNKFKQ